MIRTATLQDVNRIVALLKHFHADMGFEFEKDIPRVHRFVTFSITDDNHSCFVSGDPINGVLISECVDSQFADLKFANECVLWIEPIARGNTWMELLKAYENWGQSKKCHESRITAQTINGKIESMIRLFRRAGYVPCEVVFTKDLA